MKKPARSEDYRPAGKRSIADANDGRTFVGGSPEDFVTDEDVVTRVFSRWGSHIVSGRILNEFEGLTIY